MFTCSEHSPAGSWLEQVQMYFTPVPLAQIKLESQYLSGLCFVCVHVKQKTAMFYVPIKL